MTQRIHNFGAGPAVLPEPVLRQAQQDLLALPGVGMSVLEISHRSARFEEILRDAERSVRILAGVPEGYHVLFLHGGASLQFAMVPMNLLPAGGSADYIVTGVWSAKAVAEARKVGGVRIAGSSEDAGHRRIPAQQELRCDPRAAYLHFTTNNTIHGTQWRTEPEAGDVPLVADASSDIFSRPLDVSRYALIYAGAQKNLGPAGLAMVLVRADLLERVPDGLPALLDYRSHVKERSLYNTPPVFAIYVLGLVMKWITGEGGLEEMARRNAAKAALLYEALDSSGGFYLPHAEAPSRSLMNVTFRLASRELEDRFVSAAEAEGMAGLKGHRSVGGIRASIYNACPKPAVEALVTFMSEFRRRHG